MKFENDKYIIVKEALSKEVSLLCFNYLLIKKQCCSTLLNRQDISPYSHEYGTFNDPQVINSWACYSDILMETLLLNLKPTLEKNTGKKLIETYTYCRIYQKGNVLKKHVDRESCEISCTLNLGGDMWPIFLKNKKNKIIECRLNPGDLLIYSGSELEHWREEFEGNDCVQVFLHYNDKNGLYRDSLMFDTRPHIGLPDYTKKNSKLTRHGN
jgi:hypothetical protein